MIISVGGIKGGTGKTTIATNLAVMRSAAGKKVLLVDADEQQSVSDWAALRQSDGIDTPWTNVKLSGKTLHYEIQKMVGDYDDIIIDNGGRDTTSQRSALLVSHILLLPFKPRSMDIWTLCPVRNMISEVRMINPKLKVFAFINQGDHKGEDNQEALKYLSEYPEIKCLNIVIGNRKSFANASSNGKSIAESDKVDIKALYEMELLYKNIFENT